MQNQIDYRLTPTDGNKRTIETLPSEVLTLFDNMCERDKPLIWIASISKDGRPHVVPVCFVKHVGGNKLAIGGVFIKRTVENLKRNPQIAIGASHFVQGYDGYTLKGTCKILDSGTQFEELKELILDSTNGRRSINWLILVSVDEVFSLKPCDGKKRKL